MLRDLIAGVVILLGAAIWRAIGVKRNAPTEKHSIVDYLDAFLFPPEDPESRR